MSEMSTQFDKIYNEVLEGIHTKSVDPSDLVVISTSAMQIVQKYPNLTGSDKKRLVIDVMSKLVSESDLVSEEQQEDAQAFLQHALPNMIDTVVNAYQHKIKLKKVGQKCGCIPV